MAMLNHSELMVLALLTDGPAHGYELVRRLRAMDASQWARVADSSVYSVLARLATAGALDGTVAPGERRPARTVYQLTARGRERLSELVAQGLAQPAPLYSDRLVAALYAALAGREQALEEAVADAGAELARVHQASAADDVSPRSRVILAFYADLAAAQVRALRALEALSETAGG